MQSTSRYHTRIWIGALVLCLVTYLGLRSQNPPQALAQTLETATIDPLVGFVDATDSAATDSAQVATESGTLASASAEAEKKIREKKEEDITEPQSPKKSKLVAYLDENPPDPLSWNNGLQHAIRFAVAGGIPANTIVLVLLFPLVTSLVAASRHIVGLRGFGIYIPAVLSVALVSTGVLEGITIFLAIAVVATGAKHLIRKIKMPYLPRTALLLWMVSTGILGLLLITPLIGLVSLMSVNIFPILILVLLAENFLDAQARTKQSEALALTIETIGLAVIAGYILKWEMMQQFALTEPEFLLFATAGFNILIGKFAGLRISERLRFRALIEEE